MATAQDRLLRALHFKTKCICLDEWIEQNKAHFIPPVCNKCMYSEQLKVFVVGGPNQRMDYHVEEGEEFFFQRKGGMILKVVEKHVFKDIYIDEGEVFMLPAYIQHSPQRFKDTLGMVIERERNMNERDGLRYFIGSTEDVLFERWFHLKDVVHDLPPIIKEFHNSEACKTGKPTADSVYDKTPIPVDHKRLLDKPINLMNWISKNEEEIRKAGCKQLYGPPMYTTNVKVYGKGTHSLIHLAPSVETFLWQIDGGSSKVSVNGNDHQLSPMSVIIIKQDHSDLKMIVHKGYVLSLNMVTPRV